MKRTETREMLFKALYEIEIQKDVSEEHTDLFLENNEITDNEAISYIKKAIKEITERKDELEELISKNLKNLQKILPYLQSIGVLETVKNSASILKLTLEEIKERQAFAEKIGEPIVKNGRFNSIFGMPRKNYQKKVKEFEEKQELIGEIKGAIQEGKSLDKQISNRKKERKNGR